RKAFRWSGHSLRVRAPHRRQRPREQRQRHPGSMGAHTFSSRPWTPAFNGTHSLELQPACLHVTMQDDREPRGRHRLTRASVVSGYRLPWLLEPRGTERPFRCTITDRRRGEKKEASAVSPRPRKKKGAATYSPTRCPGQYHRRWRA